MVAKLINNVNPNSSLSMLSHASLEPDPLQKGKGGLANIVQHHTMLLWISLGSGFSRLEAC